MSCAWDIGCRTCDVTSGVFDDNHASLELATLIKNAPAIAPLAGLTERVGLAGWRLAGRMDGDARWLLTIAAFFAAHAGHDLCPRDEYGRWMEQCREYAVCGKCGHPAPCQLPEKHGGEHDPKPPVRDLAPRPT